MILTVFINYPNLNSQYIIISKTLNLPFRVSNHPLLNKQNLLTTNNIRHKKLIIRSKFLIYFSQRKDRFHLTIIPDRFLFLHLYLLFNHRNLHFVFEIVLFMSKKRF
jgi:tmRNA-binding protein